MQAENGFRHEYKHCINRGDAACVQMRLSAAMQRDPHAGPDGQYNIYSIYFDTPYDTALREKQNGVPVREKFRMRRYNGDMEHIKLEKKCKVDGLCLKQSADISALEAGRILEGDICWMRGDKRETVRELFLKMRTQLLAPKTLVVYRRTPFVCAAGNVRVTLDSDIRTGGYGRAFLDRDAPLFPAAPGLTVLEVKYDAFLPEHIRALVSVPDRRSSGFSKYEVCRTFE